jgi:hypothetical protein
MKKRLLHDWPCMNGLSRAVRWFVWVCGGLVLLVLLWCSCRRAGGTVCLKLRPVWQGDNPAPAMGLHLDAVCCQTRCATRRVRGGCRLP